MLDIFKLTRIIQMCIIHYSKMLKENFEMSTTIFSKFCLFFGTSFLTCNIFSSLLTPQIRQLGQYLSSEYFPMTSYFFHLDNISFKAIIKLCMN
jgi:hypothetical protein